jgi:hypothetical protein
VNGDRHNGFGSRLGHVGRAYGGAIAATREQLERQPGDAPFTTAPETSQWTCACGYPNPSSREICRGCREPRGGAQ